MINGDSTLAKLLIVPVIILIIAIIEMLVEVRTTRRLSGMYRPIWLTILLCYGLFYIAPLFFVEVFLFIDQPSIIHALMVTVYLSMFISILAIWRLKIWGVAFGIIGFLMYDARLFYVGDFVSHVTLFIPFAYLVIYVWMKIEYKKLDKEALGSGVNKTNTVFSEASVKQEFYRSETSMYVGRILVCILVLLDVSRILYVDYFFSPEIPEWIGSLYTYSIYLAMGVVGWSSNNIVEFASLALVLFVGMIMAKIQQVIFNGHDFYDMFNGEGMIILVLMIILPMAVGKFCQRKRIILVGRPTA